MKTTEELRKELEELEAEADALPEKIKQAEKELSSHQQRQRELHGGWHTSGMIDRKRREVRNSLYPVYDSNGIRTRRIISVYGKWITLRDDFSTDDDVTKYNAITGWRMRARDGYGSIDPELAKSIWGKHTNGEKDE